MSLLTQPVTITADQTISLSPPEGQAGQLVGVAIVNLSNFLLTAVAGPQQLYVLPGTITPITLTSSGQPVQVTASYAPAAGGRGAVGAQWYYNGEEMPTAAVAIGEQVVPASSTITGTVPVQGVSGGTPVDVTVLVAQSDGHDRPRGSATTLTHHGRAVSCRHFD